MRAGKEGDCAGEEVTPRDAPWFTARPRVPPTPAPNMSPASFPGKLKNAAGFHTKELTPARLFQQKNEAQEQERLWNPGDTRR